MITIQPIEDAYMLENVFIFGNEVSDNTYILLKPQSNIDDILAEMKKNTIDFPWEYDITNHYIRAILGKNNEMNYFIKTKNKSFAIVQTPKVLEHEDMFNVQHWIYTNEKVLQKSEQLELEGEKINLYGENAA